MSLITDWLLGSIITGNNYTTLYVKYKNLILHHDDIYGKLYGQISFLHILAEAKYWNADTANPTHPLLLPACLASLIHYFNTPVIPKSLYLRVTSRPVNF